MTKKTVGICGLNRFHSGLTSKSQCVPVSPKGTLSCIHFWYNYCEHLISDGLANLNREMPLWNAYQFFYIPLRTSLDFSVQKKNCRVERGLASKLVRACALKWRDLGSLPSSSECFFYCEFLLMFFSG
jgi:hypothetical protein